MVQLDAYDTGHAIQVDVDVAGKQRRLVPGHRQQVTSKSRCK
jgi:hypothetical protein